MGTPESLVNSACTKNGELSDKNYQPWKEAEQKIVAPPHKIIYPQQLGCLEYFHNPSLINLSLLPGTSLKQIFCRSATTSILIPTTQTKIPVHSKTPNPKFLSIFSLLSNTKTGEAVINIQNPCMNHAKKNTKVVFFSTTKRLSCPPAFIILLKRKLPSLMAQMQMNDAAIRSWVVWFGWLNRARDVIERKVRLPVISQYFSVLKILAGIKAIICMSVQRTNMSRTSGIPINYLVLADKSIPQPTINPAVIRIAIILLVIYPISNISIPIIISNKQNNKLIIIIKKYKHIYTYTYIYKMYSDSLEEQPHKSKTIKWQFKTQNLKKTKVLETIDQILQETKQITRYLHEDIVVFVKENDRYLGFQEHLQTMFQSRQEIVIQLFYKEQKVEQEMRIKGLLRKFKILENQLEGKLYSQAQAMDNLLKLESRKSKHQESLYKKTIKIIILIADPLITASKQPIYKQEFDIQKLYEIIENSFNLQSINIDVTVCKYHLNNTSLENIRKLHKNNTEFDAIIVQVIATIFQDNGTYYTISQSDENFGMASKLIFKEFLNFARQIKNLYCIMFAGSGITTLQNKSLYIKEKMHVPVFGVGTFDLRCDKQAQQFLQNFYTNIFRRKNLKEWFDNWIANIDKKQYKFTCCCVHDHSNDEAWEGLTKMLGSTIIHKVLSHHNFKELFLRKKSEETDKLVNIILEKSGKEKYIGPFKCYKDDNFKMHCLNRLKFYLKIDQESEKNIVRLDYPLQKEQQLMNNKGNIKGNTISKTFPRQRPKIIYQIIKKIRNMKNYVVCVTGEPRTGKYNAIFLAQKYIEDRINSQNTYGIKIKFENLAEEFETMNVEQLENVLEEKMKLLVRGERLVVKLNKLHAASENKLEHLVNYVKRNSDKYLLKSVCFLVSSEHRILNYTTILIGQLSRSQIKYIIFRQLGQKCYTNQKFQTSKYLTILQNIISTKLNLLKKIPFLDLAQFLKNIFSQKVLSNLDLQQIQKDIETFLKRTENLLENIRKGEFWQFWKFLGMVAFFKEGFMISKINQKILMEQFNIKGKLVAKINEIFLEAKKNSIPLYQMTQLGEQSSERIESNKWKILIRPENIMRDYFSSTKQNKIKFNKLKILYFSSFFNYILKIIKYSQNSPLFFQNFSTQGIFLFDVGPPTHNITDISSFKRLEFMQRKTIFKDFYRHHQYSYLKFLKILIRSKQNQQMSFVNESQYKKQLLLSLLHFMMIQKLLLFFMPGIFTNNLWVDEDNQEAESVTTFSQDIIDYMKFIKAYELEQKILKFQCMAIISYGSLKLITFQDTLTPQQTILKALITYQKKKQIIYNTKIQLQKISRSKNIATQQQNRKQLIDKIGNTIEESMKLIRYLIRCLEGYRENNVVLNVAIKEDFTEKLVIMIIKFTVKKIIIKFQNQINTFPGHRYRYFAQEVLMEELVTIRKECEKRKYKIPPKLQKQMKLCQIYLQEKTQKITAQLNFTQNQIPPQAISLYKYTAYRINPKSLLQNQNIILFMKSRCLTIRQTPCCFVRKGNIIKTFLQERLKQYSVNLFFMNLSSKNLDMVSRVKTSIPYIVLSVDTIIQNDSMKIVLEDPYSSEQQMIEYGRFLKIFQQIKCQFLIIFGSNSHILSGHLQKDLNYTIHNISFYLDKKYTLSTFPSNDIKKYYSIDQIVPMFLVIENNHRVMELIACSLITLLVREKGNQITVQVLEETVKKSIRYAQEILIKWYRQKIINFQHSFHYKIHCPNQLQNPIISIPPPTFPNIPNGKLSDLTSAINVIPKNFKDDDYYQMIGRVEQLSNVIKFLAYKKKCLIQILGNEKSGKTQFLKQIAWFCQTRDLFGLGVYYFDMKKIKENHMSIMEYLVIEKEESLTLKLQKTLRETTAKNYLLLLLDNLGHDDTNGDNKEFFDNIANGPYSLIYSSKADMKEEFTHHLKIPDQQGSPMRPHYTSNESHSHTQSPQHNRLSLLRRQSTYQEQKTRNWHWLTININHLTQLQKISIALSYLRNRNSQLYQQTLKQLFNTQQDDIPYIPDHPHSQLHEVLLKIKQYKQTTNSKYIIRNYLQFDIDNLLVKTDTVQKILIKFRR